jgi:predicted Zn-dependent protease
VPTIAEWNELLASDESNELVRFSLAKALLDEAKFHEALPHLERLVQEDPEYALAWALLARTRLAVGDKAGAREACDQGLPIALKQKHEVPQFEIEAVLSELESEF